MNNHFTILGHCNISINIILENLYSQFGSSLSVDIINNIPKGSNQYNDVLFLHDKIKIREFYYNEWKPIEDEQYILSGMAPSTKEKIYQFFLKQFGINEQQYISVIHKSAIISYGVTIEGPVLIAPGVIVSPFARLSRFVSIFEKSVVAHHTEIEEFSTILLGSNIAGFCNIGKKVTIGMGSNIFSRISVGEGSKIGGGSVVTKTIPAYTVSYGNPAKVVRKI